MLSFEDDRFSVAVIDSVVVLGLALVVVNDGEVTRALELEAWLVSVLVLVELVMIDTVDVLVIVEEPKITVGELGVDVDVDVDDVVDDDGDDAVVDSTNVVVSEVVESPLPSSVVRTTAVVPVGIVDTSEVSLVSLV